MPRPSLRRPKTSGSSWRSCARRSTGADSPDVDYAKAAEAFGVEGEVVKEPDKVKDALDRGKRAVAEGRPYLIDIHTWRDGIGTASTWHPPYSIADQRSRKV